MITVVIMINDKTIFARSAINKLPRDRDIVDNTICPYLVDDGTTIQHRFGDGAVVLAKKLLDTIKEP